MTSNVTVDSKRQTIPCVKVTGPQGQAKEFVAKDAAHQELAQGEHRIMDCIDCHNTIGHRVVPTPEKAVDHALAVGRLDRRLPFVRREGVRLMSAVYPTQEGGLTAIEQGLREFYRPRHASVDQPTVARTVSALQDVYQHNVFPVMKVSWGTCTDNNGHLTSTGCFRCHDDNHTAKDGSTISGECEFCQRNARPRRSAT